MSNFKDRNSFSVTLDKGKGEIVKFDQEVISFGDEYWIYNVNEEGKLFILELNTFFLKSSKECYYMTPNQKFSI